MIPSFIESWYTHQPEVRAKLTRVVSTNESNFINYEDLFNILLTTLFGDRMASDHVKIDDGDYQGTIIFIFHEDAYQPLPYNYYYTWIGYGSCSGCDALQSAMINESVEECIDDLMTICLHIVQHMTQFITDDEYWGIE